MKKTMTILRALYDNEGAFRAILEDFERDSAGITLEYLPSDIKVTAEHDKGFQFTQDHARMLLAMSGYRGALMTPEYQTNALAWITDYVNNHVATTGSLATIGRGTSSAIVKYGGVAIVAVALSWETIVSIREYWN